MERSFKEALKNRRTCYSINGQSPVSDEKIQEIIETAVKYLPSAFNSQSTRIVLLLGENHKKLWNIVKESLRKTVPPEHFGSTESKIDNSFASGYGTILFFEDKPTIDSLKKNFPLYANNFEPWSQQTSAMHQLAIWTMLEDTGLGASLQHYNPLIDEEVKKEWKLDKHWNLVAEMPFGTPFSPAGEKDFKPLEERIKVFK